MTVPFREGKGVVPAFPLPNVILYPKALLPLHIFEPRYLELVQDAIEGNKQLVLPLLKPDWERDYFSRPPVFPIAGLGEIIHWDRVSGGKYNILVRGLSRIQILEEFGGGPYRITQVEILNEIKAKSSSLKSQKIQLSTGLRKISDGFLTLPKGIQIGHLADIVNIALPIEIYRKQEIFEIIDVKKRVETVLKTLEQVLSRHKVLRLAENFLPKDVSLN